MIKLRNNDIKTILKRVNKLEVLNALRSPKRFEKSPDNIWTNEKLASFIFHSYFDENIYGGSKSSEFITSSLNYIDYIAKEYNCKKIMDLGCGPGIYTNPLAQSGYEVIGIDISEKSIEFAKKKASDNDLNIEYINDDFFNLNPTNKVDMVLMLYDIYSSYDIDHRRLILELVYNVLQDSMIFIVDVPLRNKIETTSTMRNWHLFEKGEFYNDEPFSYFLKCEYYGNGLLLNHSVFLYQNNNIVNCFDWIQHFSVNQIIDELSNGGFKVLKLHSSISGSDLKENSSSVALICKKTDILNLN